MPALGAFRINEKSDAIIGLFILINYVAYMIPNYRSAEFLVFCTLALSFRRHANHPEVAPGTLPIEEKSTC